MTKLVYFQGWGKWNAYQNLRGIYLEIYHNSRNNTLNWIREALGYTIKWLIQSNKNHVSVTNQFIMCRNQELSLIILWKNNPDTQETSLIPLHFKIFFLIIPADDCHLLWVFLGTVKQKIILIPLSAYTFPLPFSGNVIFTKYLLKFE